MADGSDGGEVDKIANAVRVAGRRPIVVAPKVGGVTMADGSRRKAAGRRYWDREPEVCMLA